MDRTITDMRSRNHTNAAVVKEAASNMAHLAILSQGMGRQVARYSLSAAEAGAAPTPAAATASPAGTVNCWEFKRCGREAGGAKAVEFGICPAYPDHGRDCAHLTGTLCGSEVQGSFAQKQANCLKCDFFKSDNFDKSF